ncbi:hypothetical protein LCGC14_1358270 [marine sediment metagenome]|uniref:Uncharacterized protein n=1 Tax=marine sediment metagenome TaxID=412755 RepID=A0A0F9NB57_9ZZZZ
MARLAIQLVGGFIGAQTGVGFGIGAFIGGIIGNLLFPPKGTTTIGPRLQDLSVNASTYGRPIPFGYGAMLYNGNIIWSPGLKEHEKSETTGGGGLLGKGGGPSQTVITFTYTASYAILFSEGVISAYSRIWGDTKLLRNPFLVQNADGTIEGDLDILGKFEGNMTFYFGTETQLPDPTMEAEEGIGNVSAHRDLAYITFTDLPLEDFGNRIPNTRAEIFTNASDLFPVRVHDNLTTTDVRWTMLNFRRTRVFAWDLIAGDMHVAELRITDLSVIKSQVIPAPGGTLFYTSINDTFRWAFDAFDNFYWPIRDTSQGSRVRRFLKVNLNSLSFQIGTDHGISGEGHSGIYSCGNYIDGSGIARTRAMYSSKSIAIGGDNILIWQKFPDLEGGIPDSRGIDINQLFTPIVKIVTTTGYNLGVFTDKDGKAWHFRDIGFADKLEDHLFLSLDEFGIAAQGNLPSFSTGFSYFFKGACYDVTTNSIIIFMNKLSAVDLHIVRFDLDTHANTGEILIPTGVARGPGITLSYFDRRPSGSSEVGLWVDLDNRFLENPDIWFIARDGSSDHVALNINVADFTLGGDGPDPGGGYFNTNWESAPESNAWGAFYNEINHSIVYLNSANKNGGSGYDDVRSYFLDRQGVAPGDVVNIKVIVDDILTRSGFVSADFDTSELEREAAADPAFPELKDVIGFAVDKQQTSRSVLEMLSRAFSFHLVETDWLIKAIWRGNVIASPDVVPIDDLGAHNFGAARPPQITETRQMDAELPSRVTLTYIDQEREYQDNTQHAKRAAELVTFTEILDIQYPIVINHSQAKLMAFIELYTAIVGRRTFEFTLPPQYIKYDPGDFLSIPVGGVQERVIISSTNLAGSGLIKMTAMLDDPEVFLPPFGDIANIGVSVPVPKTSTVLGNVGLTGSVLYLMDIPLLRDLDDGAGVYMGSTGGDGWPGDIVFKSIDGISYLAFQTFVSSQSSFAGSATTVLADGPTTIFDEGNSVTVFLVDSTHTLASVTEAQVLDGANAALIGNEITQFRDVVDNGDSTWTLSGLLRGRKGTESETANHVAGERFVFLDRATTRRIAENESDIGALRFYKAVTIGATIDDAGAIGFINNSVGQKPYSVVHVALSRDGSGNIIITWIRRTRVGGRWRDGVDVPLSEDTESYSIDILDAPGGAVKRNLTSTTETVTYTIGDQTTDFGGARDPVDVEIFQISAVVARGFKTEFTG